MSHLRLSIVVDFPLSAAEYRKEQTEYGEHDLSMPGPELPQNMQAALIEIRQRLAEVPVLPYHTDWSGSLRTINGQQIGHWQIKHYRDPKGLD